MITAHVPAGYVLGRLWKPGPYIVPVALAGSVMPDLDLIWFFFVDDRSTHHHRYWVHVPTFWAFVAVPTLTICYLKFPKLLAVALTFFAAIFLHLCLDTISGGIMWSWPFSTKLIHLVNVEAVYTSWIWNFILHPVFLLEIAIWFTAFYLWIKNRHA